MLLQLPRETYITYIQEKDDAYIYNSFALIKYCTVVCDMFFFSILEVMIAHTYIQIEVIKMFVCIKLPIG